PSTATARGPRRATARRPTGWPPATTPRWPTPTPPCAWPGGCGRCPPRRRRWRPARRHADPRRAPGDAGRPNNGRAACPFHHRLRERPPPRRDRTRPPRSWPGTPEERIARVELLRRRIADRVRHDPAWSTD